MLFAHGLHKFSFREKNKHNYWATPTGEAQFKIRSFLCVRNGIPMGRLLCCTISLASS